jgi:hypothetical protein
MGRLLWHRKFSANNRGFSALVATIIMVLVVMFLFFNVYIFTLDRNAEYQDAVSRANQLDVNKGTEQKAVNLVVMKNQSGSVWMLKCNAVNSGAAPVAIVRVWIDNYPSLGQSRTIAFPTPVILLPGASAELLGTQCPIPTPNGDPSLDYYYGVTVVTQFGNLLVASTSARYVYL